MQEVIRYREIVGEARVDFTATSEIPYSTRKVKVYLKDDLVIDIFYNWEDDSNWVSWFLLSVGSIMKRPFKDLPLLINKYDTLKPLVLKRLESGA